MSDSRIGLGATVRHAIPEWLKLAIKAPTRGWRPIVMAVLQVALIWTLAAIVLWQDYRQSVSHWKLYAEQLSSAAAHHVHDTQTVAAFVARSIADWIADHDIGSAQEFRRIVADRPTDQEMRERIAGLHSTAIAEIVATDGEILNSTRFPAAASAGLVDREVLAAALDPASPQPAISVSTSGHARIYVTRRVLARSGETLGIVAVGTDAEVLGGFLRQISVGADSWTSLFRADGTLLVTSLSDRTLVGGRYDTALPYRLIHAGQNGKAVLNDQPAPFNLASSPTRIVAAVQVEGFPLYVSVAVGESAYLAPLWGLVYPVTAIALLLTLITAVACLRMLYLQERAAAAHRADSERQVLAAIVDTPSALTAVIDRHGKVVHCNARFRELMDAGADISGALSNSGLKGADRLLAFAAGNAERSAEVDLEIQRPDNRNRMLHCSLSRQTLADTGNCVVLVGHDVTERHQIQNAIALSAKLVTLGEITTSIAHEVSQPLNVIRMAAQNALLEAQPQSTAADEDPDAASSMPDREFREFAAAKFNRIVAQVDRAASIISRMKIFNRKQSDEPEAFDARTACKEAVLLLRPRLQREGITVREEHSAEALMVAGSQAVIEQVIIYMLRNASDALAESRAADKSVEVSARRGVNGRVVVRVSDNGPGIATAIRERIFEPFFTTKPAVKHPGLGLAIAFGAVRDAGGSIAVGDNGPGAVFEIDLPEAAAS